MKLIVSDSQPTRNNFNYQRQKNQKILYISLGILFLLFNIFIYYLSRHPSLLRLYNTKPPQQIIATPSPTPTPRPIPHGKKGFTIGQSDKTVPQFSRGFIDPYDPQKGEIQTVSITAKHTRPITKVTSILKTDHGIANPVEYTLISGTNTDGIWQGTWNVNDSFLYIYKLIFQAESSDISVSVEVHLR